jgi:hypothetical protein
MSLQWLVRRHETPEDRGQGKGIGTDQPLRDKLHFAQPSGLDAGLPSTRAPSQRDSPAQRLCGRSA